MAVFCVVAPCSLVEVYQRFRGSCCLHHQGNDSSETLVNFYQTTRRYNPEDSHLSTINSLVKETQVIVERDGNTNSYSWIRGHDTGFISVKSN
jgi:hypothetical protein